MPQGASRSRLVTARRNPAPLWAAAAVPVADLLLRGCRAALHPGITAARDIPAGATNNCPAPAARAADGDAPEAEGGFRAARALALRRRLCLLGVDFRHRWGPPLGEYPPASYPNGGATWRLTLTPGFDPDSARAGRLYWALTICLAATGWAACTCIPCHLWTSDCPHALTLPLCVLSSSALCLKSRTDPPERLGGPGNGGCSACGCGGACS